MTVTHAPDVTDKFSSQIIRNTAKALVSEGTFRRSDLEDVVQDLRLALLEQAVNFDPEKSKWSTFVKHVVRQSAVSLRRRQRAQRRQGQCELRSLNVRIDDGDGQSAELGATISEEEHRSGRGQACISHTDQADLAMDVQGAMNSLPAELQEICERLKYQTPTEVRRELGITRTTMERRMELLRQHFREAGVSEVP
jgi:RNA polymerase sigma-70 factor (ECF subfamily)